jgi:SAM-dependent methyltransferase
MGFSLFNVPWFFNLLRRIVDGGQVANLRLFMARITHESVLDIGCGTGNFCWMTDRRYLGVDIEPAYIAYAKRRFGQRGREFMVADARALDASVGKFDVVSFINLIHHFPDDSVRALFEKLKAVKPRYFFVVDVALERGGVVLELFRRLDRGKYYRPRDAQIALLESCGCHLEWVDLYWSRSRIYPHSVILARLPGAETR